MNGLWNPLEDSSISSEDDDGVGMIVTREGQVYSITNDDVLMSSDIGSDDEQEMRSILFTNANGDEEPIEEEEEGEEAEVQQQQNEEEEVESIPPTSDNDAVGTTPSFKLVGMTMQVKNPKYIGAEASYEALQNRLREVRNSQEVVLGIRRSLYLLENPALLFEFRNNAAVYEARNILRVASESGNIIDIPPAMRDEMNREYNEFCLQVEREAAFPKLVQELTIQILATRMGMTIDEVAVEASLRGLSREVVIREALPDDNSGEYDNTVLRVKEYFDYVDTVLFAEASEFDYSQFPLTIEILEAIFYRYVTNAYTTYIKIHYEDRYPGVYNVEVQERDNVEYYEKQITSAPVSQMLVWLAKWQSTLPEQQARFDDAIEHVRKSIYTLVTGGSDPDRTPTYDAINRGELLPSVSEFCTKLNETRLQLAQIQAALSGDAPNEMLRNISRWNALSREEAIRRELSAQVIMGSVAARLIGFNANGIYYDFEVQRKNVLYALETIEPYIDVPLVEEREIGDPRGVAFTIRVEGTNDAGKRDILRGLYTYEWYFDDGRNGPSLIRDKIVAQPAITSDTLQVVENGGNYYEGIPSGTYYVRVTRLQPGDGASGSISMRSQVASLIVYARCLRDGVPYQIGPGIPRTFGECSWKTYPVSSQQAKFRQQVAFRNVLTAFNLHSGTDNGFDYIPIYDDVITDENGYVIVDDDSLLNLYAKGDNFIKTIYFSFLGLLRRLNESLLAGALADVYTETVSNAILEVLLRRNARYPILAALSFAISRPSRSEIAAIEQAILVVRAEAQANATADPESAFYNEFLIIAQANEEAATNAYDDIVSSWSASSLNIGNVDVRTLAVANEKITNAGTLDSVPAFPVIMALTQSPQLALLRRLLSQSDTRFLRDLEARLEGLSITTASQANVTGNDPLAKKRVNDIYARASALELAIHLDDRELFTDTIGLRRFLRRIHASQKRVRESAIGNDGARNRAPSFPSDIRKAASDNITQCTSADWSGYHSQTTLQPLPYQVLFDYDEGVGASQARIQRGSKRLFTHYDFDGLHERIQKLVASYNAATSGGSPALRLKSMIERLVVVYNVLSQFAPKLYSANAPYLSATEIEKHALAISV